MGSAETNEIATTVLRQYSQTIFDGSEFVNLMPQVGNIDFIIPSDAPATVKGIVANIAWTLKATVDVARARDVSQEIDLVVLPVPGYKSGSDSSQSEVTAPAVSQLSECDINLSLASLRVSMGESVDGIFRIIPKEGFELAAAKIELMRTEKAGNSETDRSVDFLEFQIYEATRTLEAFEFPFSLPVPECLLATISVHQTSVAWRVQATVTLSGGKELEISQGITVRGSA